MSDGIRNRMQGGGGREQGHVPVFGWGVDGGVPYRLKKINE